ncbi:PAS and ANTAR domain-containing protein [Mycobacterium helveticum]|jgi:PAS domain S-box-containing protein|uniref:histidine kinase n=1 Tax=Mycobacterium helveticum TaxID=2592811 RepID=A0A557XF05_9MYCO|nr:PAS and ANTAR domain-containing protein [Mycobacterium helveticum]TVS84185.1 ANTAR domain-containing protein [Mycobacterium helveticum]TVS85681.1 ANTAR domain-containing protein [Mycobacterium helveticum]
MTVNFQDGFAPGPDGQVSSYDGPGGANGSPRTAQSPDTGAQEVHSPVDLVLGPGEPQQVGRFRFFLDGERWEWSDAIARMHGYQPGSVEPTTELLLEHKHPEDRERVAAVLEHVRKGEPFSSRHRIIDTAGRTHWVVVAGDRMVDDDGKFIGMSGFYVDVTESLQSTITDVMSSVAVARARIEQAKGVLMAAYGISAERAFHILAWRSQEANVKLRDLAARFLDVVSDGRAPADTRSHVDHALLTLD